MEATTAVRDTDALCANIVTAIADLADADPTDMPPLGYAIDPEALDTLVNTGNAVQVMFEYQGHTVVVDAGGTIAIDGEEYDDAETDGGQ